jgi:hypothetical protein
MGFLLFDCRFAGTAVLRYFWIGKSLSGYKILYMVGVMAGLSMVPLYEGLTFHEVRWCLFRGQGVLQEN